MYVDMLRNDTKWVREFIDVHQNCSFSLSDDNMDLVTCHENVKKIWMKKKFFFKFLFLRMEEESFSDFNSKIFNSMP